MAGVRQRQPLIGALALLVVTVVLKRMGRPVAYTLIPAVFMLLTTIGALIYTGRGFLQKSDYTLAAITAGLLVLSVMMVVDSVVAVRKRNEG